jgi:hypothetical protein
MAVPFVTLGADFTAEDIHLAIGISPLPTAPDAQGSDVFEGWNND